MLSVFRNKKKSLLCLFLLVLLLVIIVIWFADRYATKNRNDVAVLNIQDSQKDSYGAPLFSCGDKVYLYLDEAVYEYVNDNDIRFIKEIGYTGAIAATEKYIYYSTSGGRTLVRMETDTGEEIQLLEDTGITGIYTNGNDCFVCVNGISQNGLSPISEYSRDTFLYEGDSEVPEALNRYLQEKCLTSDTKYVHDIFKGEYKQYTLYGNPDEWTVEYVEGDDCSIMMGNYAMFTYNGTFLAFERGSYYYGDNCYDIALYEDESWNVHTGLSVMKEDNVYTVLQMARGYTAGSKNPLASQTKYDALVKISIADNRQEIIYQTEDNNERIVGFDADEYMIYTYERKSGGIYRVEPDSGQKTLTTKLPCEGMNLDFTWNNGKLFVIRKDIDANELLYVSE